MKFSALLAFLFLAAATGEVVRAAHRSSGLRGTASGASKDSKGSWNSPDFFNGFSDAESTWNYDGAEKLRAEDNPMHNYVDGYNPDVTDPFDPEEVDVEMFAESKSAGAENAWQSYYPVPARGPAGHDNNAGDWYRNSQGTYIDAYEYPKSNPLKTKGLAADFYDSSVNQYDNYGRPKVPYPGNPDNLLGYVQQAVNTSLSCESAGCNASVTLNAFKVGEDAQHCFLSVFVKPTDFNGENKQVEFITVNDRPVALNCQPSFGSCSETQADVLSDLQPCVNAVSVMDLLNDDGTLVISAKISEAVNDSSCAYQGSLLYAVPEVTCMVGASSVAQVNITNLDARPEASPVNFKGKASLVQGSLRMRRHTKVQKSTNPA